MGTDMPPSRYRVVERGRRLIVIDNHNGAPVTGLPRAQQARVDRLVKALRTPEPGRSAPPPPQRTRPAPQQRPIEAGDPTILTTQSWFDDKAPRRVRIGQENNSVLAIAVLIVLALIVFGIVLFGWPALVVLVFLLAQKAVRAQFRRMVTHWLDGLEQLG
jgi:hypothetical protein